MTEREMLELAAKAAGIVGTWHRSGFVVYSGWVGGFFNPLTDDGDALRLAVKLKLDVDIRENYSRASSRDVTWAEDAGVDQCKSTRMAIVIAAAKVCKEMK